MRLASGEVAWTIEEHTSALAASRHWRSPVSLRRPAPTVPRLLPMALALPATVHARDEHWVQKGPNVSLLALAAAGFDALGVRTRTPRGRLGPVRHHHDVAHVRSRWELSPRSHGGRIVEWLGESQLRAFIRGRDAPVPDALVHWSNRDGAFFLDLDRGTETLATLTAKLHKYAGFWRSRSHRQLPPGLSLRPRLVILLGRARAHRLVNHFSRHSLSSTALVGASSRC